MLQPDNDQLPAQMSLVLKCGRIRPDELLSLGYPPLGIPIEFRPDRDAPGTCQMTLREEGGSHPSRSSASHIRDLLRRAPFHLGDIARKIVGMREMQILSDHVQPELQ